MEEVAASAQQVSTAATEAKDAAQSGQQSGERAGRATRKLTETGEDLVEQIAALESRIGQIVDVVNVIAEVADQTNLLALNANIEAARVGADGSGFEVVANEVKALAEETRSYTEEISANVERVRRQTTTTVSAVETSNDQIRDASAEIEEALDALARDHGGRRRSGRRNRGSSEGERRAVGDGRAGDVPRRDRRARCRGRPRTDRRCHRKHARSRADGGRTRHSGARTRRRLTDLVARSPRNLTNKDVLTP